MTALVVLIALLLAILSVSGRPTIETNIGGVPITSGYPGRSRRTHSHLPKFSKKDHGKGKGKGAVYVEDDEYVWVYEKKSSKSKSSKKDSKKEKYVRVTRKPTEAQFPTVSPPPMSTDKSRSKSGSSSEDCPPARPPSVVPGKNPTQKPSVVGVSKEVERVGMDTYAIDYTLSQAGTAPSKADFRELQTITESFFKKHMVDSYKASTQAELVDFTTSFVTAHFTPGEPVHVQYNSTASFDKETSVSIPTSETLLNVLKQAVEFPKAYTDELKSKLSEGNPFANTNNVVLTDPKATPKTRKSRTTSTSVFGIAGAGAVMVLTLAIFAGIVRGRNEKYDDEHYNEAFKKKHDHCDITVAGETFVSEINDSTYDGNTSFCSSSSSVVQRNDTARTRTESSVERNEEHEHQSISQREDEPIRPQRRPRTVAEIEQLLSLGYDGVI